MLQQLATASGLLLASLSPALAQNDQLVAPREGDIYGHVKHQPTEAEIGGATGGEGINAPSDATKEQVEKGVEELLRQTDEADKALEERLYDQPGGYSPAPGSGGDRRE